MAADRWHILIALALVFCSVLAGACGDGGGRIR
jgi:hypothetical protein